MEVMDSSRITPESLGVVGVGFIESILENSGGLVAGPERELFAAILFDGIQSYFHNGDNIESKNRRREASCWIARRGDSYIFSFDNVCDALGINPEWLRIGLQNIKKSNPDIFRGRRRNGLDSIFM